MQISVRLNGQVERQLENAVNAMHKPRNAIINDAILFYLDSMKIDAIQENINSRMEAFNNADKLDDVSDFGDWP